jgi:hypothetical protein
MGERQIVNRFLLRSRPTDPTGRPSILASRRACLSPHRRPAVAGPMAVSSSSISAVAGYRSRPSCAPHLGAASGLPIALWGVWYISIPLCHKTGVLFEVGMAVEDGCGLNQRVLSPVCPLRAHDWGSMTPVERYGRVLTFLPLNRGCFSFLRKHASGSRHSRP